ncbi:glycoside hydrolase family 25 protein [Aliikangiella maris]|uniref:Glycoside hydrolase family 25 protein n=2 Tax=Aliikangiella maris TaxID=3162458 RepID=A0ABV2BR30_9GAMM
MLGRTSIKHYSIIKLFLLIGILLPSFLWLYQLIDSALKANHINLHSIETWASKKRSLTQIESTQDLPHAAPGKLHGVDVSHYQGIINWQHVKQHNIHFTIAKATGGETYIDPQFKHNWQGMRASGFARGAYHFFYANDDPHKQANHFLTTVGEFKASDLPPILDVEITDHVSQSKLLSRVLVWLETVEKKSRRLPILYTDVAFAKQYLNSEKLSKYPLWIADYNKTQPPLPSAWQKQGWQLWQFTQSGNINGINGDVDLSRFKGNAEQFAQFIRQTHL